MVKELVKLPSLFGLDLEDLRVQDIPGLHKTSSGSVATGETYSLYSGSYQQPDFPEFATINLRVWDHTDGYPNHITIIAPTEWDIAKQVYYVENLIKGCEFFHEDYYIWKERDLYVVLNLSEDLRADIYINRNAELEPENFSRIFHSECFLFPDQIFPDDI